MRFVAPGSIAAAVIAALLVVGAATAFAGDATPEEKCSAAKTRAVGKNIQIRLGCVAKGTVNIDFDPDLCIEKAQMALAAAFARAEAGTCTTIDDEADWELMVQDFVDSAELDLAP